MIKLNNIIKEIIDYEFDLHLNNEIYNVLESPARIGKINMDILDNTNTNYEYSLKAKQYGKSVGSYKEYEIYQFFPVNKPDDLHDVFIHNDLTYVYFNYIVDSNSFILEKKIWQNHLSMGLFREIVFNYYLTKFKGVISDELHSPSGEKYWGKLLKKAKENGYGIYVLSNNTEKTQIENPDDISKYFTSTTYRFVIQND
jgi:hypothetical protein